MSWQPGQPVLSVSDEAEWQAWRRLASWNSNGHGGRYARIDYYPNMQAGAASLARTFWAATTAASSTA